MAGPDSEGQEAEESAQLEEIIINFLGSRLTAKQKSGAPIVVIGGPNVPKIEITYAFLDKFFNTSGNKIPPDAIYAIHFLAQGNIQGYDVYLGPNGVCAEYKKE